MSSENILKLNSENKSCKVVIEESLIVFCIPSTEGSDSDGNEILAKKSCSEVSNLFLGELLRSLTSLKRGALTHNFYCLRKKVHFLSKFQRTLRADQLRSQRQISLGEFTARSHSAE